MKYIAFIMLFSALGIASAGATIVPITNLNTGSMIVSYSSQGQSFATSQLQNNVSNTLYGGYLVISVAPDGTFIYALTNTSAQGFFSENTYQNTIPNQYSNNQTNITISLTNYIGSIYYSDNIDITPIEEDSQSANLTAQNFFNFVSANNGQFANATILYQGTVSSQSITSVFTDAGSIFIQTALYPFQALLSHLTGAPSPNAPTNLAVLLYLTATGQAQILNPLTTYSTFTPVQYAISNLPSYYSNLPLEVIYDCNGAIGTDPFAFNSCYDSQFAAGIAESQFLSDSVFTLLMVSVMLVILKKFSGE